MLYPSISTPSSVYGALHVMLSDVELMKLYLREPTASSFPIVAR